MKIVITIVGHDRVGIVAGISAALALQNVNILDIQQNIVNGFFNMIMIADASKAVMGIKELQTLLREEGERLGVEIKIQHEDIFTAMHRV